jgi:hypothetical protein
MRALTMLVAGYPGPYVPPKPVAPTTTIMGMPLDQWLLSVGIAFLAVVTVLAFMVILFGAVEGDGEVTAVASAVAFIAILGVIFCGSGVKAITDAEKADKATARAAYDETLVDWLEDDYGIVTDVPTIGRLLDGDTFVADYDGRQVTISLSDTVDGKKALVDENRAPLEPLAD